MSNLTSLGAFHTAISLIALGAGVCALVRYKEISLRNFVGKLYVITTVIVCLTGFGIYQHGGFGQPHVLGIVTLVVLSIAAFAQASRAFGGASRYVETVLLFSNVFLSPDSNHCGNIHATARGSAVSDESGWPGIAGRHRDSVRRLSNWRSPSSPLATGYRPG